MGTGVETIIKELERLGQEIKRDMDKLGIEETLEGPRSERLKEIISRFTIMPINRRPLKLEALVWITKLHSRKPKWDLLPTFDYVRPSFKFL